MIGHCGAGFGAAVAAGLVAAGVAVAVGRGVDVGRGVAVAVGLGLVDAAGLGFAGVWLAGVVLAAGVEPGEDCAGVRGCEAEAEVEPGVVTVVDRLVVVSRERLRAKPPETTPALNCDEQEPSAARAVSQAARGPNNSAETSSASTFHPPGRSLLSLPLPPCGENLSAHARSAVRP